MQSKFEYRLIHYVIQECYNKHTMFCIYSFRSRLAERTRPDFPLMCGPEFRFVANRNSRLTRPMSGFSVRPVQRVAKRVRHSVSNSPKESPWRSTTSHQQHLHLSLAFFLLCCWLWLASSCASFVSRSSVTATSFSRLAALWTGPFTPSCPVRFLLTAQHLPSCLLHHHHVARVLWPSGPQAGQPPPLSPWPPSLVSRNAS